jgi:hypothetical protein
LKHYSEGNIGPAEISFNYGPDMLACSLVTVFNCFLIAKGISALFQYFHDESISTKSFSCSYILCWLFKLSFQMRKLGLRPSKYTYDGFVKTVIAGKGIAYAIKVVCLVFSISITRNLPEKILNDTYFWIKAIPCCFDVSESSIPVSCAHTG